MTLKVAIEHSFRDFTLSVAFEAPMPGVVALFGPSGSGKSTVMNAIAGLLRTDRCKVELEGETLSRMRLERRGIGYVFQEGRLFPHLSVQGNLRYGLRRAGKGPVEFDKVVDLLGLGALLRRRPYTLSGGERQRVAIGRALLSQPRLLLMDEPLSALDQARRDEILPYLSRLRTALAIPIVYASHALDEVSRLADTLVVLGGGRVLASGPVGDVLSRVDLPLAIRDDAAGVLQGRIVSHEMARGLTTIACGGQLFLVPLMAAKEGTAVRLRVPAREIIISMDMPRLISVNNVVPAVIAVMGSDRAGHAALLELDIGGASLLARITQDAASRLNLMPGSRVLALVKAMSVELLN